ncbi:MAG: DUF975 family protein [Oscillospiraceae bacterium]|jgi:uncharacterized membrane protein|nr:DUF975 family protein [Oscillospiraceae bacterium]
MFSTRQELKRRAKEAMEGTKPSYMIFGIIMVIALNAESWLTALFGKGVNIDFTTYEELMDQITAASMAISLPLRIASLALALFVGVLAFGFKRYCLRISRGEKELGIDELVSGFPIFWKIVGLNILSGLFVMLWSLLLFIPGIIAVYRYRMAEQVLIDHPDWGIIKCISESKRLMKGNKARLCVQDLSFFGWMLLSSFVTMITFVPVMDIWLNPYMTTTECCFYNELKAQDEMQAANGSSDAEWWEN